jgi:autophagy-related protein 16
MQDFLRNIQDIPSSTSRIIQDYQALYLNSQGLDQEELSKLYKSQAQTSTRLLELLDTLREKEELISKITIENSQLLDKSRVSLNSINDLKENIREKEGVIQILQDELSAHQLEILSKEKKIKELQEKISDISRENQELVEKIVQVKQEQANSINESNENRWSFLRKNVVKQRSNEEFTDFNTRLPSCVVPRTILKKIVLENDVNCITVSKDGELVATGSNDKNLMLFNAKTGAKVGVLSGAMQGIMFTDFSGSELVLGASNDQSVKIWQVNTQRLKTSLTGHVGKVYSARFIQDKTVISGSHDRTIKVWDLTKGYCVKTIFSLSSCNDLTAANLDGSVIISGHLDSNIRFWDSRTGSLIREIIGAHAAQVTGVQMFSDWTKVLTTSRDNTLKVIDVRKFEPVLTIM